VPLFSVAVNSSHYTSSDSSEQEFRPTHEITIKQFEPIDRDRFSLIDDLT
jgi:hypothetical protein